MRDGWSDCEWLRRKLGPPRNRTKSLGEYLISIGLENKLEIAYKVGVRAGAGG